MIPSPRAGRVIEITIEIPIERAEEIGIEIAVEVIIEILVENVIERLIESVKGKEKYPNLESVLENSYSALTVVSTVSKVAPTKPLCSQIA